MNFEIDTLNHAEDILAISSALLKTDTLEIDDDLRTHGADSLLIVILLQLLKERNITIDMESLDHNITVRSLVLAANATPTKRPSKTDNLAFRPGSNIYSTLRQGAPNKNYHQLFQWNLIGAMHFDFEIDFHLIEEYFNLLDLEIEHIHIEGVNQAKLANFKLATTSIEQIYITDFSDFIENSSRLLNLPSLDRPLALALLYFNLTTYAVMAAHHYYADDYALNLLGRSLATFIIEKRFIPIKNKISTIDIPNLAHINHSEISHGLMPELPPNRLDYCRVKASVSRKKLLDLLGANLAIDDESLITYAILHSIYGSTKGILFERQHSGRNDLKSERSDIFAFLTDIHPCVVSTLSLDELVRSLNFSKEHLYYSYYDFHAEKNENLESMIKKFLPAEIHLNIRHDLNFSLPIGAHAFDYGENLISEENYAEALSPVFKYDISVLIRDGVYYISSYSKFNEWLRHTYFV